ncbi:MAG: UDP-3-O-(3-hydroxymyristoyl)glucosamine N-acyltransferase [Chloracidobacterium sp.]|uniref:UDP-3-O-acylglucosamine N-acyltransferase n=1 Tax=Chloracidobacterium validum TaxID=2821543 RepID=A0ABX8BBI6_9BACT|nr:UDP-3-O-(3-hydroxymyristoyl)glucosamine N-acyltransferase [Chloracidobacterium validum]QUW03767.1 UDP-3-O-(3-hydroxymyristoyl)glucosamine N-acyltransferase [Chloracidobacterium validum]
MAMKLGDLAAALGVPCLGNPDRLILGVAEFETASPTHLTLAIGTRRKQLASSRAAAFIVAADTVTDAELTRYDLLPADYPKVTFAKAIELLHVPPRQALGIAPEALLAPDVVIGEGSTVGPRAVIGAGSRLGARVTIHPGVVIGCRVEIGDDTTIFPNVTVYDDARIGARCILHAGVVIGADGYGYARDATGAHVKIPQVGTVIIEDDVEIGANSTIDRATLGETRIGRGTKIDNLVHIAHNCVIGEESLLAALVGLSGGVKVGRRVTLAGQVGANPQVEIGDGAIIAGKAGITKSVAGGETYAGVPITTLREWKRERIYAARIPYRLPDIETRLAAVEARLDASQPMQLRQPVESED